ncbi:hypothetical protein PTKU46_64670 [Paraburkholderia terrae]|uniref:hypothetical protein n=1 Tax=Paraburkholderia terrae TaxID=311230 RepID=UPI0030DF6A7E
MANLEWAIEKCVTGTSGEPLERDREAVQLSYRQHFSVEPDDLALIYRLAMQVPAKLDFAPADTVGRSN